MDVDLFLSIAKRYQYHWIDLPLSVFLIQDDSCSAGKGALYKSYVELNIVLIEKFGNASIPKRHMMRMATIDGTRGRAARHIEST